MDFHDSSAEESLLGGQLAESACLPPHHTEGLPGLKNKQNMEKQATHFCLPGSLLLLFQPFLLYAKDQTNCLWI